MAVIYNKDNDAGKKARKYQIDGNRRAYLWDHQYLDPIPMLYVDHIHKGFGILDLLRQGVDFFKVLPEAERPHSNYQQERTKATAHFLERIALDGLKARLFAIDEISDYERYISGVETPQHMQGNPDIKEIWRQDDVFAYQRVAGVNPIVITLLTEEGLSALQQKFPITDHHLQQATHNDTLTLAGEIAAQRLFVCDYKDLAEPTPLPAHPESKSGTRRYPFCIGLFRWNPENRQLEPVAIQLTQTPSQIYTPDMDGDAWLMAKLHFQVSDFNHHEMGTHLSNTHFIEEGFAVATARTLPDVHPVSCLLRAHFDMLLFNNWAGRELLVEPKGFVDKLMAGDLEGGSIGFVKRWYTNWTFSDWDPVANLQKRGLLSPADATEPVLPIYPWRDDGLKIWAALGDFITEYIGLYYNNDAEVAEDPELHSWVEELTDDLGAHVPGFPTAITTRSQLSHVLQTICFQASAGHASINYPQFQYMFWVPNDPGAMWADPPVSASQVTEADILRLLPGKQPTRAQTEIIWILTCYLFGRLGQYEGFITDDPPKQAVIRFQQALQQIEGEIRAANGEDGSIRRRLPYIYLLPSNLPNSTNM